MAKAGSPGNKNKIIRETVEGFALELETAPGLFSPDACDCGTLAMLACASFQPGDRILDLGCGYGLVGIVAALKTAAGEIWMSDVDPLAVEISRRNAARNEVAGIQVCLSDGFAHLNASAFDWILCNPPYHADFAVAKHFIEKGFNRLKIGGRMLMVTKRKEWYRNKLIAVFGGVRVTEKDGYRVFMAERRQMHYASKKRPEASAPK